MKCATVAGLLYECSSLKAHTHGDDRDMKLKAIKMPRSGFPRVSSASAQLHHPRL